MKIKLPSTVFAFPERKRKMVIPAAMNIYSAQDMLKSRALEVNGDEIKELRASNAGANCQNQSDFEYGYLLGLETARALLAGSAELVIHGVDPNKVL